MAGKSVNTGRPEAGQHYASLYNEAQLELAALREDLASVRSMACMLEHREWAEHAGKGPIAEKLESAITEMHNELSSAQQSLTAAEQRNAELVELLREVRKDYRVDISGPLWTQIDAALKPTESGASGSTCNQIREESGLPINKPCVACNNGACIDK